MRDTGAAGDAPLAVDLDLEHVLGDMPDKTYSFNRCAPRCAPLGWRAPCIAAGMHGGPPVSCVELHPTCMSDHLAVLFARSQLLQPAACSPRTPLYFVAAPAMHCS